MRNLDSVPPGRGAVALFCAVSFGFLALCFPVLPALRASELTAQEVRGKRIFLEGESDSGEEIVALMGDDAIEVPAAALPCASCHGPDGRGRPEGGVSPTDLTWDSLTKPYGVRHDSGREHPAYTERGLKKAIAMGFDPAGNKLNLAMPRYRMTLGDMNDLVAYLKKLGRDQDPGIGDETLRLGTVLPPEGGLGGAGDAVAAMLMAYFDGVNRDGGLYGRSVELVLRRTSPSEPSPETALRSLSEEDEVFAVVAPMITGSEEGVAAFAETAGVPVIGPFALFPELDFPLKRQVFYIYPGLAEQGRALVEFAKKRKSPLPAAVLYPASAAMEKVLDGIVSQAAQSGWESLERRAIPHADGGVRALVTDLAGRGVETLFFLGSGPSATAFFDAAGAMGFLPGIYAPGSQIGRAAFAAPPAFDGRIHLAFPTLPKDATPRGLATYRRLRAAHDLPDAHHAAQISALAAAELVTEGLKQAGRDLSRERLIAALEGLYDHETGLTPALSFGPNRRVGAQGAYVMTVDLRAQTFQPGSDWIEVR